MRNGSLPRISRQQQIISITLAQIHDPVRLLPNPRARNNFADTTELIAADLNGTITGEWSLSTIGITEGLDDAFYKDFFLRQVANFERGS